MLHNRTSSPLSYAFALGSWTTPRSLETGGTLVLPEIIETFVILLPREKTHAFHRKDASRPSVVSLGKMTCSTSYGVYIFEDNRRHLLYVQNRTDRSYTFTEGDSEAEEPLYTVVPPRSFVPVSGMSLVCSDYNEGTCILSDASVITLAGDNAVLTFSPSARSSSAFCSNLIITSG